MKAVKNIESNRTPTELFVGHWVYLLIVCSLQKMRKRARKNAYKFRQDSHSLQLQYNWSERTDTLS